MKQIILSSYLQRSFPIFILLIFLQSCFTGEGVERPVFPVGEVDGYKPIYGSSSERNKITVRSPQPLTVKGKIYVKDNLLLISSPGEGIHIFDNTDQKDPKNLGFVAMSGNMDIAIKGNLLYADQFSDLVVFDITDIDRITVVERIEGVFESTNDQFLLPPKPLDNEADGGSFTYFECVDLDKGVVVGWERTTLNHPNCYL